MNLKSILHWQVTPPFNQVSDIQLPREIQKNDSDAIAYLVKN